MEKRNLIIMAGVIFVALILMFIFPANKITMEEAIIKTNKGDIKIALHHDKTPVTVENFVKLAQEGEYNNIKFHRVIEDFMIQTGDPLSKDPSKQDSWGTGGPGYEIEDEFSPELKHDKKGLLSMANSGPNTGGSQFFITLVPTLHLDNKHAIFGHLTAGEDILDKIGNTQTDSQDKPLEDMIITKITIN